MTHADRAVPRKRGGLLVLILLGCLLGPGCAIRQVQGPADALLLDANEALRAGRPNRAEMLLERALRVEPRKATSWHLMGQVRFGQRKYGQAIQFCLKSNSLAGQDTALVKQNWQLIERSYTEMGETEKAATVRRQHLGGF